MNTRWTLTASITLEMNVVIRCGLSSGRYSGTSEVTRAALQLLETNEDKAQLARVTGKGSEQHRG